MNKSIANTVRAAFALFLLGLGMYASIDTLVAKELASRGLSTCGDAENPCALAPLTVTASATGRMVSSTAADESRMNALGAAPHVPAAPHVATAES